MKLKIYIKKWLKKDITDDYIWLSSESISQLRRNSYVEGTKVLKGTNKCNIILKPNANIEIEDIFHGKIIGLGNNIVRIKGEFIGILSCSKIVILKGGKLDGKIWLDKMAIEDRANFTLKGYINPKENSPKSVPPEEIDFRYVEQLE